MYIVGSSDGYAGVLTGTPGYSRVRRGIHGYAGVFTGTPGYSRVNEGPKYTDGAVGVDRVEQPHGRARREADDVVALGAHLLGDAVLELPRLRLAAGVS